MPKSIEIFENTLLKLVIRSGSDSDRQTITLDSGELGYTTDTKRLYVGDGVTKGGILVGNVFKGNSTPVTNIGNSPAVGDLAFDTSNNVLYRLKTSNHTTLSSWEVIGGVYQAANDTIKISSTNTVSVCAISAYNISSNALGRSLTLNSGQVTLSSTVAIDRIINNTSTFLALPSALNINNNEYKFPSAPLSANTFLRTDAAGNLSWTSVSTLLTSASALITLGSGLTATVDGVPTSSFRLSASNIKIDGLFLPKAHVTFNQVGTELRKVGVGSVFPVTFDEINSSYGGNISLYGFNAVKSTSRYDYPGASGYIITFNEPILNGSSPVIDVQIKNATYFIDDSAGSFLSYNPTVVPYYRKIDDNTLLVTGYVVPFNAGGTVQRLLPARITLGYNDNNTRFSVTVY